jgi:polysaccharide biosynthesis protein PslG
VARRSFFSCILLVGLLSLGAALSSASGEGTTTAGRPSAFFGISPQTALHRDDLSLMRRTGIGSLRFPIYWSLSEPARGLFDWRATDAFLISTSGYGFERLPVIWGSPSWATGTRRAGHCGFSAARCEALQMPVHTLAQRRAWASFLRALVGRYGPNGAFWELHTELPKEPIRTWQIWNEENDHRFAEASVGAYAGLLRGSAPAIRSVDPDARILLGGLYATPRVEPALDATTFLSRLYGYAGIKALFDGVALHPYAYNPRLMAAAIGSVRAVMRRHGDGAGELFVTEFGWGSQTRAAGGDRFERGPAVQAEYLKRAWAILLANRRRWHLRSAFWFTWQDIPAATTRCDFCDSNGLLRLDGLPKRALSRFAQVAHG